MTKQGDGSLAVMDEVVGTGGQAAGDARVNEQVALRGAAVGEGTTAGSVLVAPWGRVESSNGSFVLDEEAARLVIEAFEEHGTDLPIDYEHQSLGGKYSSPTGQAPAAGWIRKLRVVKPGGKSEGESGRGGEGESGREEDAGTGGRGDAAVGFRQSAIGDRESDRKESAGESPRRDDAETEAGLYADVEWTEGARARLAAREYRYLSPVVIVRKRDRRVVALHSAALTNKPAIVGMRPIVNSECEGGEEWESEKVRKCEVENVDEELNGGVDLHAGAEDEGSSAKPQAAEREEVKGTLAQGDEARTLELSPGVEELAQKMEGQAEGIDQDGRALEMLRMRLGLEDGSEAQTVILAAERRLDELMQAAARKEAEEQVAAAARAGKLVPAQREWALRLALRDPRGFAEWAATAPAVVMLGRTEPPGESGGRKRTAVIASARAAYRAEAGLALLTSESAWVADTLRQAGVEEE